MIIIGGSKQADKRWYETNIPKAETLFLEYLEKQRRADGQAARKEKKE